MVDIGWGHYPAPALGEKIIGHDIDTLAICEAKYFDFSR